MATLLNSKMPCREGIWLGYLIKKLLLASLERGDPKRKHMISFEGPSDSLQGTGLLHMLQLVVNIGRKEKTVKTSFQNFQNPIFRGVSPMALLGPLPKSE